ncbi:MAG TPA: hypothetical protein DIT25_04400 [Candidatus Moranbacteria bacterium]|nr:hypothetical protein [Candidatus Moranbacteria bacterium]
MNKNIIIPDGVSLEKLKKEIAWSGAENFYVLADFNRTLTKAFIGGKKASTSFASIRSGKFLPEDYVAKAEEMFEKFHLVEIDPNMSAAEKNPILLEWWKAHFQLLIDHKFGRDTLEKIGEARMSRLREGAEQFLDFLHSKNIPLVIVSSGLGDIALEHLRQAGKLTDNVHMISNLFEFDENGKATGYKDLIVHPFNKTEIKIENLPVYEKIKNRKNILLLGDEIDDLGMLANLKYDNLIKIGFLNEDIENNLESFKGNFDIVILGDGNMNHVNELIKEICS